jgi:hypothetical protein
LIAAAAEDASVGVPQYDDDFDVLAGVLAFREPLDRRARCAVIDLGSGLAITYVVTQDLTPDSR